MMEENENVEAGAASPAGIDPDYIDGIRFATATTNGYTMREVDEFLDTVSAQARVTIAEAAATAEHNVALEAHVQQLEAHARDLAAHFEKEFAAQAATASEALASHEARLQEANRTIEELRAANDELQAAPVEPQVLSEPVATNGGDVAPKDDPRVALLQAEVDRLAEELVRAEAAAEAAEARSASAETETIPAFAPDAAPAAVEPGTVGSAVTAAERLLLEAGNVADQLAEEARDAVVQAQARAEEILAEAHQNGETIQADARTGVADLQERIDALDAVRQANEDNLRGYFQEQLSMLNAPMDPDSAMFPAPEGADEATQADDSAQDGSTTESSQES